jgi:membrane protease YdiL (CAAX protease family)
MQLRGFLNSVTAPAFLASAAGVRTAYRVALFIVLYAIQVSAIVLALGAILARVNFPHLAHITPLLAAINEATLLLPTLTSTAALAFLENRPFTAYGLRGDVARLTQAGFVAGLLALTLLIAALFAAHLAVAAPVALPAATKFRYGAEWFAVSAAIGVTEEILFRGYLLTALTRGFGGKFWPPTLITGAVFAAGHGINAGEGFVGLMNVLLVSLLFCAIIRRTGSLFAAIGFHAAWDFGENFLFGTPDSGTVCYGTLMTIGPIAGAPAWLSGGATGPEGSVVCTGLVLILLASTAWRRA